MKKLALALIRIGERILKPRGFMVSVVDIRAIEDALESYQTALLNSAVELKRMSDRREGKKWVQ